MDGLLLLATIVSFLGVFGALAIEFGVDSRDAWSDPRQPVRLSV
jgi:hypothetical protein